MRIGYAFAWAWAIMGALVVVIVWTRWRSRTQLALGTALFIFGFLLTAASINEDLAAERNPVDSVCRGTLSEVAIVTLTCTTQPEGSLSARIWEPVGTGLMAAGAVEVLSGFTRHTRARNAG